MKNILVLFVVCFFSISLHIANAATETVVIQPGPDEGKDTYFGIGSVGGREGRPDNEALRIGGWGDTWVTYIEFNLKEIPDGAIIQSADLELYQWRSDTNTNYAKLYRVTEPWDESDPRDTSYPASIDFGMEYQLVPTNDWLSVDLTDLVENWQNGTYENYGLKILAKYSANGTSYSKEFWSSDYMDDPTLRPKLVVTYELPDSTPEELVGELSDIVANDIDKKAIRNSYFAHIKKFLEFYNGAQIEAALNQIGAFLKKVTKDTQQGDIAPETGDKLQELGNDLQEQMETSSSQDTIPHITQVSSAYPSESD